MDTSVEEALVERELVAALKQSRSIVATGSQSSGSQMPSVESISGDVLGGQIETLRHARAALVADRKRLMKELECRESSTPIEAAGAEFIHGLYRTCNADACNGQNA